MRTVYVPYNTAEPTEMVKGTWPQLGKDVRAMHLATIETGNHRKLHLYGVYDTVGNQPVGAAMSVAPVCPVCDAGLWWAQGTLWECSCGYADDEENWEIAA